MASHLAEDAETAGKRLEPAAAKRMCLGGIVKHGSLMINAIGGIELRSHSGPVRATSAEGSIAAELIAPDSACTLVSREGDIALKLLPNSAVDIDALSSSGSIMNMLRSDTSSTERPIYGHFMESLNGGGTPIVIRTERGTIQLSEYGE